jgi:Zn finger protein HypA/HybF involved in hydrogenase expression
MPPRRDDIRDDISNEIEMTPTTRSAGTSEAAAPARNDIRNDDQAAARCPVCTSTFVPVRRQQYCTPACRQAAWRARHQAPARPPVTTLPPRTPRRDHTVYQCPACDTRRLGQQWCPDCHRPALRVDLGGLCPHCDQPITISDITDQHPTGPTSR